MKFGPVSIEESAGKILAHNISDEQGRRRLRKGLQLGEGEIETLRSLGRTTVYVAELEAGDVPEDQAARRIADAVAGPGIQLRGAATGRTNLLAGKPGMIRIDVDRLTRLNTLPGITLATVRDWTQAESHQLIASVKIIPYAVPGEVVRQAEKLGRDDGLIIRVLELPRRSIGLVLMGDASVQERLQRAKARSVNELSGSAQTL